MAPRNLWKIVLLGIAAAPLLRYAQASIWPGRVQALMPTYMDCLLLGVLGAILMRNEACVRGLTRGRLRAAIAASGIGVSIFVLVPHLWNLAVGQSLGLSCVSLFFFFALLYPLLHKGAWATFLRLGPLRWLGSISYGTYLFHEFVSYLVAGAIWSAYDPVHQWPWLLLSNTLALMLTLAFCQLSWTYFEKPFIDFGRRREFFLKERQVIANPTRESPAADTE